MMETWKLYSRMKNHGFDQAASSLTVDLWLIFFKLSFLFFVRFPCALSRFFQLLSNDAKYHNIAATWIEVIFPGASKGSR